MPGMPGIFFDRANFITCPTTSLQEIESSAQAYVRLRRAYTPPAKLENLAKFPGGKRLAGIPLPLALLTFLPLAHCVVRTHPPLKMWKLCRFLRHWGGGLPHEAGMSPQQAGAATRLAGTPKLPSFHL